MPRVRQSTSTEMLSDNIMSALKAVIPLLDELHDGFGTPFVQNVKKHRECFQLAESIHAVIYAIINLHIRSGTAGSLPPATLEHVGNFTETLHKIHTFVEAQQASSRIKHFFRQSEMNTLLKDCKAGLQEALEIFKVQSGPTLLSNLGEIQKKTEHTHEELLELISNLSDCTISDCASSVYHEPNDLRTSSSSFSILPAQPQIFHGRESELEIIVQMLHHEYAKIVILGAGGMGKTSLARAALHHSAVTKKYEHRFFVSCESASTSTEIAGFIGAHLGLKSGKNLTKSVFRSLAEKTKCLLILDNLETTWEPLQSRSGVEDLISLLTDVPRLALIVTMRGAERPAGVRWTRPFLQPLGSLSDEAARQTFAEIADNFHKPKEINQLLQLTSNMPLAVDLMARLVYYEGCAHILARWETEKTSLLSEGNDRRSNLEASIALSLSSPRLVSQPGAVDLLSLLSILPDGLSGVVLNQSSLPIPNILACRATLLGTSLAYLDDKKRLKSLGPIREYMQHLHPPAMSLIWPIQHHFQNLLNIYRKYHGSYQVADMMTELSLNLGNMHHILQHGLIPQNPDLSEAIQCTISLNVSNRHTGHGWHVLMDTLPSLLQPSDHRLKAQFITEVFNSCTYHSIEDPELLASEARSHLKDANDPALGGPLYRALGYYYSWHTSNRSQGIKYFERALAFAKDAGDIREQATILINSALLKWRMGEYVTGQVLANDSHILAKMCGNYYQQANALRVKAMCCQALGNLNQSLLLLQTAKDYLSLCGMSRGGLDSQLTMTQAVAYTEKSEYIEAKHIYNTEITHMAVEQTTADLGIALMNVGVIDIMTGVCEHDVLQSLESGKAIFSSIEFFTGTIYYEMSLADLKLRGGDTLAAKILFQKCLHWSWTGHTQVSSYCLERMADISRWGPANFYWASTCCTVYLALAHKVKLKLAQYKAICFLGDTFLITGDDSTAESLFTVALGAFTYMDVHQSRANCLLRLGDIAWERGDMTRAAVLWKEARPLFEQSQQSNDLKQIDERLIREHGSPSSTHRSSYQKVVERIHLR